MRQRFPKHEDSSSLHGVAENQRDPRADADSTELRELRPLTSEEVSYPISPNMPKRRITETFYIIMEMLPRHLVSCLFPDLPHHYKGMLSSLSEKYLIPYNRENPAHVNLLRRLWKGHQKVIFGDAPFEPIHAKWMELGFQSEDPSTDFRGAGVFALEQLVHLVEMYPKHWSRFLNAKDFILSCAAINVSMRIITLLRLSSARSVVSVNFTENFTTLSAREKLCGYIYSTNSEVAFFLLADVFCCYMCVLEKYWSKSEKNLLQFNHVLGNVYKKFERAICMSKTIDDLFLL